MGVPRLPVKAPLTNRQCEIEAAKRLITPAESKLLNMLIEDGPSNDELAERLGISPETVKRQLWSIMNKTGYGTRLELAVRTLHERYEMRLAEAGELLGHA